MIETKVTLSAMAGVAQWIECQPANQRVTSSVPSQGTHLGCGPGSQLEPGSQVPKQPIDVSLPPFPSL